ncbi:MAG: primosomal protein N' [Syntrophomonadaceae bacterium]
MRELKTVELVINLSTSKLNATFTYLVPPQYEDEAVFGKRVLVDFGGRREEGFIVAEDHIPDGGELKPILKVLDTDTIFEPGLLALARWMADHYLCPLAAVLNLMVPKILRQKKGRIYLAGIDELEYEQLGRQGVKLDAGLMALLWETGGLSQNQVLKYINEEDLRYWTEQGYLITTGTYHLGRRVNRPRSYILGAFDPDTDLPALHRRAPRQAAIMEMLLLDGRLDDDAGCSGLPPSSLKALLNKGYIQLQPEQGTSSAEVTLTDEQGWAAARIGEALRSSARTEFLLFGVTGSGKTEVYVQAARDAIEQGRGVLVLVPEIALTRQLVEVFASRIPDLAVLHSAMSAGERYEEWRRIKTGEARLVLGARSAVFAPMPDLGLIIMDEEQESTYKQEEAPRYHTREVARYRASQESAVLILGSATPSLETFHAAYTGTLQLLPLSCRIGGGQMPRIFIEDLKKAFRNDGQGGYLSPFLCDRIRENLDRREQTILFINRRGYSPMTVCWECGNIASCPSCSVGMTYHSDIGENVCHYCNLHLPADNLCPVCGGTHLQLIGAGTQRIEEHIRTVFPQAVVARLDVDSSRRKGAQKSILDRMRSGQIDILVGTQMVAKGLDFPNVSLVGVIDADGMLSLPDFRAGERCFQLLVQAAGRAGRSKSQGEVVIQTFNPDHPIISLAANHDFQGFYEYETNLRRRLNYPPFTRLLRLVISGEDETAVQNAAVAASHFIEERIDASEADITVIGPASCPIAKVRNRYRHQLMVKCRDLALLRSVAAYIMARPPSKNVKIDIDFDPVSTL